MPDVKEPHYFGADLLSTKSIKDLEHYLDLFTPRRDEKYIGEASVYYLYSSTAAKEINAYNPDSRIIIMLRNPVEMVHSLHAQAVSSGNEDIIDFASALDAEEERRHGVRIPDIADFPQGLLYCTVASYQQQVRRFLEVFGQSQVRIILFDDFLKSTSKIYRDTLTFIGVENTNFEVEFETVNSSRRLRSVTLEHFLKKRFGLRKTVKRALPSLYSFLYSRFHSLNAVESERDNMDPKVRTLLRERFASDVDDLGGLIGKDLKHWLE